jgi:tetratricopeptide (TPR) repeat protein
MRRLQSEYLLKGVYLGLLLYAALRQGEGAGEPAESLLKANLPPLAGLVLALLVAAVLKIRQGYRVKGRPVVFGLILLLESGTLVYAGIIGGALVGAWLLRPPGEGDLLVPLLAGGAGVGFVLGLLRQLQSRGVRLALVVTLAAGLVGAAVWWLSHPEFAAGHELHDPMLAAWQLLLGIPFFYLLTFAGHEEESEVEIGAMCALLGLALATLTHHHFTFRSVGFIVPVIAFFWYTTRVLPALRVLKHAFHGMSYARVGNHRRALQAFRRALQLDPKNKLAREGFWDVHRTLDVRNLAQDPETLSLLDLDLCLERVATLLVSGKPTPAQQEEANRLLELVVSLRPAMKPAVDYWRAVALTHDKQYEQAAEALARVLDPTAAASVDRHRKDVLLPAWRMAMTVEELRRRAAVPQLALPGRRMEAILTVERHLAENPQDQDVWGMKRMLYHEVTEADYDACAGAGLVANGFDHEYVQQLGLALIDDNARWQRGGEYLRMASRGLPTLGPTLFVQVAQAHQRAGRTEEMRHAYELAKRAGRSVGPKTLADAERHAYFSAVKILADEAMARGDLDAAVENLHLFAEYERSGLETLRTLAEMHERRGDPLSALRVTDQALLYNGKDKDLLERKDRYYYSVMPADLTARLEAVRAGFDVAYCVRRTRTILDGRYEGVEWLDVASHLVQLALIVQPADIQAKVLQARVRLRYGERDEAIRLLEEVRGPARPENFETGEDEEAWFQASQLLGDLYMETGRADLAVPCFLDFRKSSKSGAKTLYKLGQAYEQLGDAPRAIRCYKQVTAYKGNPLTPEAYDALHRLGA